MSTRSNLHQFRLSTQLASLLGRLNATSLATSAEVIEAQIGETLTRVSDDDLVMLTRIAARLFKQIKDEAQRREGVWARCLGEKP